MSSKKTNNGNRSNFGRFGGGDIRPIVEAAPVIISLFHDMLPRLFPAQPEKVLIPQLCDENFPVTLNQATKLLTDAGLKVMSIDLTLADADPKYKDYRDTQITDSDWKYKQMAPVGTTVMIKYITQEVIDESRRLYDAEEKRKADIKRAKDQKRKQHKEQAQKAAIVAVDKAKDGFEKILPHQKKFHKDNTSDK